MAFAQEVKRFNKTAEKPIRQPEIRRYLKERGVAVSISGLNQCINGKWFRSKSLTRAVREGLRAFAKERMATTILPDPGATLQEVDMLKPVYVERKVLGYFGLPKANPFEVAPKELYKSSALEETAYAIRDCIANKKFLALIGPVGSGKTSLIHDIETQLAQNDDNYIIRPQVFAPGRIGDTTLLEAMLRDMSRGAEIVWGNYEKRARRLADMFRTYVPEGRNFILIIDNAHELSDKALKFLKRIYDNQVQMKNIMSIVLVGQREFKDTLGRADLSEVSQRIMLIDMPDCRDAVRGYVEHRAGADFMKKCDAEAFEAISAIGSTHYPLTPLLINNLICRSMRTAYKQKAERISASIIRLSLAA